MPTRHPWTSLRIYRDCGEDGWKLVQNVSPEGRAVLAEYRADKDAMGYAFERIGLDGDEEARTPAYHEEVDWRGFDEACQRAAVALARESCTSVDD